MIRWDCVIFGGKKSSNQSILRRKEVDIKNVINKYFSCDNCYYGDFCGGGRRVLCNDFSPVEGPKGRFVESNVSGYYDNRMDNDTRVNFYDAWWEYIDEYGDGTARK